MMISAVLLMIGGAALLSTILPDEMLDDNKYDDSETDPVEISDVGYLLEANTDELELPEVSSSDPNLNMEESEELEFGVIPELETNPVHVIETIASVADNELTYTINFDAENSLGLPPALSDWGVDDAVPVLELGQGETLTVNATGGVTGSLVVMEANYVEIGSEQNGGEVTEHTGLNIYFVPASETFPENYEWSAEGATLVDTTDYKNDDTDFGEIKLLSRIDSGSWTTGHSEAGGSVITEDDRIGVPTIASKLNIIYK